jgi:glycosyltransferase involved in cell wall biosynthesis
MQQYRKPSRLEKLIAAVKIKASCLLEPSWLPSKALIKEVEVTDPLRLPTLEKVYSELLGFDPGLKIDSYEKRSHDLVYASQIFKNSLLRFKLNRRLTHLRLPKNVRASGNPVFFHSPLPYPILLEKCANITTIHDIIPITHSAFCLDDPEYWYDLVSSLLKRCDAIHCISHYTARGIEKFFGSQAHPKLFVAHQPINLGHVTPEFEANSLLELRSSYEKSHAGQRYILQIGAVEPKKNHQTTIEAFQLLRKEDPSLKLVVLGKAGWLSEDLCDYLESARSEGIEWVRAASYASLVRYLRHASAVVFPSIVEGWGLPPLEAMSYGVPVVASPIEPCKEALGQAPLYMDDASDAWSLAEHLRNILANADLAAELVSNGFSRAKMYSHSTFAAHLSAAYAQIPAKN